MNFKLLGRLCVLFAVISGYLCLDNPYKILGVDKKSALPEIKKAYKQLAKEW
jgi:DnaJ-class molecular chaperone